MLISTYFVLRSIFDETWIGFHDPNYDNKFVWFNGNSLPDDEENWAHGKKNPNFYYFHL